MADHSDECEVKDSQSISLDKSSKVEAEDGGKLSVKDAGNDGLDDLLDSALDDFEKPLSQQVPQDDTTSQQPASKTTEKNPEPPLLPPDQEAMFNQLFAGGAGGSGGGQPNFESLMGSVMSELSKEFGQDDASINDDLARLLQGGGGSGFPGFGTAPPSEGATSSGGDTLDSTLGDTINRLVQSAQELKDGSIPEEEVFRQMEKMHIGDGSESEMMPMMQQMMQSLLSKDILYPSLKEVVEKYPLWLEENETKVEAADFERYTKQFGLMRRLCTEYEAEDPSDSANVKEQRMTRIMDLIQEMEGLGQPPADIVGEGGAGLGLQFDSQGMPKIPGMPQGDQCSIM